MRSHLRADRRAGPGSWGCWRCFCTTSTSAAWRRISRVHTDPAWLALSLASMVVNLAIRSLRWQYLLDPLGGAAFANAFRATAIGFAASAVLPARAGEVIRPYFLSRHGAARAATGAFATIILERLLDVVTVLMLLASFGFVFGRDMAAEQPVVLPLGQVERRYRPALVALAALAVLFVLAGDPERLGRAMARLERVAPSGAGRAARERRREVLRLASAWSGGRAGYSSRSRGRFRSGCASRSASGPSRSRSTSAVPFTGSFLLIALLGAGRRGADAGRHRRISRGLPVGHDDVLWRSRTRPAVAARPSSSMRFRFLPALLLGLLFAAQAGLKMSVMRQMAAAADDEAHPA